MTEVLASIVSPIVGAGGRRPAQQRIGVEVAQDGLRDGGADLCGFGDARRGVVVEDVKGAADEAGEGDEVLLRGLLGGGQGVPFEGQRRGEIRLGERHADDGLCVRVSQRASVEIDLQGACFWGEQKELAIKVKVKVAAGDDPETKS